MYMCVSAIAYIYTYMYVRIMYIQFDVSVCNSEYV